MVRTEWVGPSPRIHTAFIHDFSNYAATAEADGCAIETLV
jgi:hypothetical protein